MNTPAFEALEPRQLLAFSGAFTDADGDPYTVELTGPGTVVVQTSDDIDDNDPTTGFAFALSVTGTTAASRLKINVGQSPTGDGRIIVGEGLFSVLRSASLPRVDIQISAIFVDVGQLTLGNLLSGSSIEVSVAQSANNFGARTAAFNDIGDNGDLEFGEFLARVTMNNSVFADMGFDEGVGLLQSKNDLIGRLDADPTAVFSQMRAGGVFRMRANIGSDVKSIVCEHIQRVGSFAFRTAGSIGSISAKTTNDGVFQAKNFGKVTGESFSGVLSAFEPDAKGNTFGSLRFTGALTGVITITDPPVPAAGIPGRIASLVAGSMNGAQILAGSIGTLRVAGAISGGSGINLLQTTGIALRSMIVGGTFTLSNLQTAAGAGVASFRAQGLVGASVEVGFITSLRAGTGPSGGVRNSIINFSGADAQGFAVKTADLGETLEGSDFRVINNGSGAMGTLKARVIFDSGISAAWFGSVTATGVPGVFGDVFVQTTLQATAVPPDRASIGTLNLRGIVRNAGVAAAGSINSLTIGAIPPAGGLKCSFTAGNSAITDELPADSSTLLPSAKIGRITILQKFTAGAPSYSSAIFLAPTIDDIRVNGLINTTGQNDGGLPFGFAARTFGKVSLKNLAGATVKPVVPAVIGDFNPISPDSPGLFTFRVLA